LALEDYTGRPLSEQPEETIRSLVLKNKEAERLLRRANRQKRTLVIVILISFLLPFGLFFEWNMRSKGTTNTALLEALREERMRRAEAEERLNEFSRQKDALLNQLDALNLRQQALLKARRQAAPMTRTFPRNRPQLNFHRQVRLRGHFGTSGRKKIPTPHLSDPCPQ
jgi:hypothetical protein